jgi:Immunity protein 53
MIENDTCAVLRWLEDWYQRHCNGEWEHAYGVQIESLDNPGWIVRIDLKGTELEQTPLESIQEARTETDWINCSRTAEQFVNAGGARNLIELAGVFRAWVEGSAASIDRDP